MKKNKNKSSGEKPATSGEVEIASDALARLADKLKVDLANPQQQAKQKSTPAKDGKARAKHDSTAEKKTKRNGFGKSQVNGPSTNGSTKEQTNKKDQKSNKSNVTSTPKPTKDDEPSKQHKNKKQKVSDISAKKPQPVNGTPTSQATPTKKDEKFAKDQTNQGKGKSEKDPLFDEIIALGGTEEDLGLIEGINSDEDIEGEASSTQKSKHPEGNDGSLQKELQAQLKALGLTGKFPDVTSEDEVEEDEDEDEEYVTELGESDEEAKPLPPSKAVSKAQQQQQLSKSEKPQVIDRPVQLSSSHAPTTQLKPNGLQVRGKLQFEPHPIWYLIERPPPSDAPTATPNSEIVAHLHARGKHLLQIESDAYMSSNHITSSDRQFLSTIMTSGTQTDKLSALTLSISASPLHCQKQLDALLGMAKKKSRNEAVQAVAALKDLLVGNLLPDRKLVYFGKQPGLSSSAKDEELILWTFEDWLKGWYFQVLQVMEGLSMDPLPFVRNHMIAYILDLLKDKPEQEQLLLRLLVNKLGDGSKKIAAKASYFILQLESAHPQMKSFVLHEMENLLFRPNTSVHAQYYTIITMNQTILTSRDTAVANRLIEVYFMLFVKLLRSGVKDPITVKSEKQKKVKGAKKKKRGAVDWENINQQEEEVNSKILSAVLTGVNRAFPFSMVENDVFEKHVDILYRITHDGNFNTAIQALILLHQVVSAKHISTDRYYRTLYESLLDRRLTTSSKQALYLNLLFKSLKSDTNIPRVKAFIKRIVHITSIHSPGFICGSLFLLAELTQSRPELKSLWSHSFTPSEYDPRKRDPLYAHAESSSLWELSPLLLHYHPTVQLYALNLLQSQVNTAKPDLALHTVKHFLDRFVYRNPKQKAIARGGSIMQPLPGTDTSLVLGIRGLAKTERAVNSEEWWRQQVDQIKPDEIFFHRFFVTKEESEVKALGRKRKRGDDDDEDLDEDEIWEALVKSSREEGGIGDVDVDVDDDDESVDWSDEDEEMIGEMNDDLSDMEDVDEGDVEGAEEDVDEEEVSGEEGDIDGFFDDEAEELSEEEDENEESIDSEEDSVDGRFEFGDDESDMMGSDEEIEAPVNRTDEAKNKKRKLKNLPIFASAEDYADMLD